MPVSKHTHASCAEGTYIHKTYDYLWDPWDFMIPHETLRFYETIWYFVILCDTPWDLWYSGVFFCVYKAATILSVFPIPFSPRCLWVPRSLSLPFTPWGYPSLSLLLSSWRSSYGLLWPCPSRHSCFALSLQVAGAGTFRINAIIICRILASLPLASYQFWDQRNLSCY
jgi:hypothetical protein